MFSWLKPFSLVFTVIIVIDKFGITNFQLSVGEQSKSIFSYAVSMHQS